MQTTKQLKYFKLHITVSFHIAKLYFLPSDNLKKARFHTSSVFQQIKVQFFQSMSILDDS